MIDSSYLVDSSVWIDYLLAESERAKDILKSAKVFTSALTLFEVKKKMLQKKLSPEDVHTAISIMAKRGPLLVPTTEICNLAAELSIIHNLAAMDALIYATAQHHKLILVTGDNDFRKLKDVKIL
ncbi:MAG TPA: PIN domain-containing protein [Candidatus Nanoarchaeia archaeon]|nr:PIN domain-containing protein [Candidatus Nanoarchaeia archaeon]